MWRCEPFVFPCRGFSFKGYIHSLTLNGIPVTDLDIERIEVEFMNDICIVLLALHAVLAEDTAFQRDDLTAVDKLCTELESLQG